MSAQSYYNQHPNNGQYSNSHYSSQKPAQHNMNVAAGQEEKGLFSTIAGAGLGGYVGSKLTHHSGMGKLAGSLIGGYAFRHGVPGFSKREMEQQQQQGPHRRRH